MFVLFEMQRDVRVDPLYLGMDRVEVIRGEINKRMSNRILLNVGLCMVLWDIKSIGDGIIFPGDGGVHSKVVFRYVIFRPFQDEIIEGKIKNSTPDGIQVTLQFFDDILIPPEGLQYPSRFDKREQIWIWEYKNEENDEVHEMYMDKGETIKFRVTSERFFDTTPIPASAVAASTSATASSTAPTPLSSTLPAMASSSGGARSSSPITTSSANQVSGSSNEDQATTKAPYSILGTINEPGLGLLSWWS